MNLVALNAVVLVSCMVISTLVLGEDISQEYFTDALITCNLPRDIHDKTNVSATTGNQSRVDSTFIANVVWLIPSGEVLKTDFTSRDKFCRSDNGNVSTLLVKRIDEPDFGTYTCILIWNDSNVSVVINTVNKDGASIEAFLEEQKKNAIVGAIAAGVVFVVMFIAYLIWRFTCSERVRRKRRLTGDLAKGVNRYSTEIYDNVGFDHYVKKSDK